MRTAALAASFVFLLAGLTGCPKRVEAPGIPRSGPPRPYPLLSETAEKETSQLEARREDIQVDTPQLDRTPRVVATGETPLLELNGARARLYGDADARQGWSVDNFVLLEILDAQGKVIGRANAGFAGGVSIGAEHIDNIGRMSFQFEPGEIDLTSRIPEGQPFRVRATALDFNGVGRVSNLYLVLEYPERDLEEDDLRGE